MWVQVYEVIILQFIHVHNILPNSSNKVFQLISINIFATITLSQQATKEIITKNHLLMSCTCVFLLSKRTIYIQFGSIISFKR